MPCTSLRATLGGMSALAVVLVASVTLSIALTTSIDAIRALGERHAAVLLSVADDATLKLFMVGTNTVAQVDTLAGSRVWPWPSDDDGVLSKFEGAISARFATNTETLTSVNLYFSDNSFTSVVRHNDSMYETFTQRVTPHATTFPDSRVTSLTGFFNELPSHRPLGVRPTNQPSFLVRNDTLWNTLATSTYNAYGAAITPPYAFLRDGTAHEYITMVAPLYPYGVATSARRPENTFGYVLASLRFDQLNLFLRRVRSTPNTAAFAFDRSGNLLGASTDVPVSVSVPVSDYRGALQRGCSNTADFASSGVSTGATNHQVVCRLHVTEYPHAELNAVAAQRPELLRRPLGEPTVAQVPLDSGRVYAAAAQVRLAYRGLEVHLLLLMPEADVIGDVITGRNVAIGVTCALVVLAATVNVLVVWALLAPLGGIAERMVRAANLEDDAEDASVSVMAEVAELQQAYYAMNDELNRIRSYVPQSVLVAKKAEQDGEGHNADDEEYDEDADEDLKLDVRSPGTPGSALPVSPGTTPTNRLPSLELSSNSIRRMSLSMGGARGVLSPKTLKSPSAASQYSSSLAFARGAPANVNNLPSRAVSIVVANLRGLHGVATGLAGGERVAVHVGEAVKAVERAVTPRQGVLTFHGDRFLATFNAARPCAGHAVKAASVAAELLAGGTLTLPFTAGVATGPCLVGPVGSATLKTHSVIGAAVSDAAALERLAREHHADDASGAAALATFRTATEAQASVRLRFVDLVALPGRDGALRALAVAAVLPPAEQENGTGDGAKAKASQPEDGEWMYVAAHAERTAGPYDACFAALQRGDAAGCLAAFAAIDARNAIADAEGAQEDNTVPQPPARLREIISALRSEASGAADTDALALCRRRVWTSTSGDGTQPTKADL